MKRILVPAILAVVVVVLAIVYFKAKPEESMEAPQNQTGQTTSGAVSPKTPAATPTAGTVQVDIKGFAFVGQTVRIAPGTTIRWKNFDTAKHTVTSDTGVFNSGIMVKDQTFSYKFTKEGTYKYKCALHPDMTGEIVVRAF